MYASVEAFLSGIVDYAGLFPPAQLTMPEAHERFRHHRLGPHGFMLARFVCPAQRLGELQALLDRSGPEGQTFALSVLGRGGDTSEAFLAGLDDDLGRIQRFLAASSGRTAVHQIEVRLPDQPGELAAVVSEAVERLESTPSDRPTPFFEWSLLEGRLEGLPDAVRAIAGTHRTDRPVGLKIRCGGADAAAVPTAQAVAAAIVACTRAGVPIKATQGLHHPVRHLDRRLGTQAHGFLNLFSAGLLAHVRGVREPQVLAIIDEQDPSAFQFTEFGLCWRDQQLTVDELVEGRRTAVTSFGSCSFSEPVEDLLQMGVLGSDR
jgi:hypothetical protein